MTKDEALKLALEALEVHGVAYLHHKLRYEEATTAIKKALAQPAQEPERPWVWLTDEEIRQIARNTPIDGTAFARAIEQALKEKNQ